MNIIYYSGDFRNQNEVAIIVNREIDNAVTPFVSVLDRNTILKINIKPITINIIV